MNSCLIKVFFLLPELTIFGSPTEIELQFVGFGIILNLFKYGLLGILIYVIWIFKIYKLIMITPNKIQKIIILTFLIYCLKIPFFISHLYFVYLFTLHVNELKKPANT